MEFVVVRAVLLFVVHSGCCLASDAAAAPWSKYPQTTRLRCVVEQLSEDHRLRLTIANSGADVEFIVKEEWSGGLWIDTETRRITVAHYAYSDYRQNELRGGWMMISGYKPEFYEFRPGETLELSWPVPESLPGGLWEVVGAVSAITEREGIPQGTTNETQEIMTARDVLVLCGPTTINRSVD